MPNAAIISSSGSLPVNARLYNDAVRHAVFLERLKTGEAAKIVGFLNDDVYPDITARIEARLSRIASRGFDMSPATSKQLKDTYSAIRGILHGGMARGYEQAAETLKGVASMEAEFQTAVVNRVVPKFFRDAGVTFTMPSGQLLRAIVRERPFEGRLLKDWFGSLANSAQVKVEKAVSIGLAQGDSVADIVRRVRGTAANGFADGAIQASRREAEAVVRTAINHTVTQARELTYEENDELIDGVQFVATLDTRTTPQCQALDGKVFKVGEGPRPPIHFNCRSTTVPVLKSWRALGFDLDDVDGPGRASMNGVVPEKVTYGEWLRNQPRDVQDEVLGREKAKLFRKGAVPIDRFVDDRGRPLNLADIRQREGLDPPAPRKVRPRPSPQPEISPEARVQAARARAEAEAAARKAAEQEAAAAQARAAAEAQARAAAEAEARRVAEQARQAAEQEARRLTAEAEARAARAALLEQERQAIAAAERARAEAARLVAEVEAERRRLAEVVAAQRAAAPEAPRRAFRRDRIATSELNPEQLRKRQARERAAARAAEREAAGVPPVRRARPEPVPTPEPTPAPAPAPAPTPAPASGSPTGSSFGRSPKTSEQDLGGGINATSKVDFADGVSGVYKPEVGVDDGFVEAGYTNVYKREVSASVIDRLAGFDLVPETVEYQGSRGVGSLQRFVKDAKMAFESNVSAKYDDKFFALDVLLANVDRHGGNAMIIQKGVNRGKWVAIDNGFTLLDNKKLAKKFYSFRSPENNNISGFSPKTLNIVRNFLAKETEVRTALKDLLTAKEIDSVFDRARFILAQKPDATMLTISRNFTGWIKGMTDQTGVPIGRDFP
jgi:SPP1 gp7 family putative phage head morphogenesis protein